METNKKAGSSARNKNKGKKNVSKTADDAKRSKKGYDSKPETVKREKSISEQKSHESVKHGEELLGRKDNAATKTTGYLKLGIYLSDMLFSALDENPTEEGLISEPESLANTESVPIQKSKMLEKNIAITEGEPASMQSKIPKEGDSGIDRNESSTNEHNRTSRESQTIQERMSQASILSEKSRETEEKFRKSLDELMQKISHSESSMLILERDMREYSDEDEEIEHVVDDDDSRESGREDDEEDEEVVGVEDNSSTVRENFPEEQSNHKEVINSGGTNVDNEPERDRKVSFESETHQHPEQPADVVQEEVISKESHQSTASGSIQEMRDSSSGPREGIGRTDTTVAYTAQGYSRSSLKYPGIVRRKYPNTYQLEPMRKFSADRVKEIIIGYLMIEENAKKIEAEDIDIREAAQELRRRIIERKFDRYRISVLVTMGRLDQYNGFHQDLQCLWDADRDRYQYYVHRSVEHFILVLCFGIYRD